MHNHSLANERLRTGETHSQPDRRKGMKKTRGNLCRTIAQQKQDQDRGKPVQNHSKGNARLRPREACAKTHPSKWQDKDQGKPIYNHSHAKALPRPGEAWVKLKPSKAMTKSEGSLCTTIAQKMQDQNRGKPQHNHMLGTWWNMMGTSWEIKGS